MRKVALIVLSFFVQLFLICQNANAKRSTLWGDLPPGSYGVGFKVINAYDFTRTYGSDRIHHGLGLAGLRARRLPIHIWYPANIPGRSSPMVYRDYVRLGDKRIFHVKPQAIEKLFAAFLKSVGAAEDKVRSLLNTRVAAVKEAPAFRGTFPLVVLGPGISFEPPVTHVVLCEYLASQGYVVATYPAIGTNMPTPMITFDVIELETSVRDMEFVISRCRVLPQVDATRIAVAGFDLGGLAAMLTAIRYSDVDAIVSLDNGIIYEHNLQMMRQLPYYKPDQLRVPLIHITSPASETEAMSSIGIFDPPR